MKMKISSIRFLRVDFVENRIRPYPYVELKGSRDDIGVRRGKPSRQPRLAVADDSTDY